VDFRSLLDGSVSDYRSPTSTPTSPVAVGYTQDDGHPKGAVLTHRAILMNTR